MRSKSDPISDAIADLTEAARGTRTVGAGTQHERSEPVDFGEIACHVLTAVAANVGGVDRLLSGRPGSWEADYVRQIVLSTAGDSAEDLLRWRTGEPSIVSNPTNHAAAKREAAPRSDMLASEGVERDNPQIGPAP